MDIKLKNKISRILIFLIVLAMTGGLIYGIYFVHQVNTIAYGFDNKDVPFEESDYYEATIKEALICWLQDSGLYDDIDAYSEDGMGNTNGGTVVKGYLGSAEILYKSYGTKEKDVSYQTGDEEKKYGVKSFKIRLDHSKAKFNKDGTLISDVGYEIMEDPDQYLDEDQMTDTAVVMLYGQGNQISKEGFTEPLTQSQCINPSSLYLVNDKIADNVNLPPSFYINLSQKRRIESANITIGFTKNQYQYYKEEYNSAISANQDLYQKCAILFVSECVGAFLLLLLFGFQTQKGAVMRRFDYLWSEVVLIAIGCFIAIGVSICAAGARSIDIDSGMVLLLSMIGVALFVCIGILTLLLGTCMWRIKEHRVIDSFACLRGIKNVRNRHREQRKLETDALDYAKKRMKEQRLMYHYMRRIGIGDILISILFISNEYTPVAFVLILLGILTIRFANRWYESNAKEQIDLSKLVNQIQEISNGNLHATTDIEESSMYYDTSKRIENIGEGMEKAMDAQLRGERMKMDLITNVSHDLKTPLTSIISYIDLLGKDENLSDEAKDYVAILNQKTDRLRVIISDLFELAKSTSGEAKVDIEVLDMKRLVEQVLVEMNDKIEASPLAVRFQCRAKETKFAGDSARMYRVLQNIIENALKYSMEKTRIYINIEENEKKLICSVINTASYEMNFTKEEVMERFYRGDQARTSEGNGLGLSIADSFIKICGGEMKIEISGDQFKVLLIFDQIV